MEHHSPFSTIRGRVVAVYHQKIPFVEGGRPRVIGKGSTPIKTRVVDHDEFWLRDAFGQDHPFIMGDSPLPRMLPGHDVSVVSSGGAIVSIFNHSTGDATVERYPHPSGPYRTPSGSYSSALCMWGLAAIASLAIGWSHGIAEGVAGTLLFFAFLLIGVFTCRRVSRETLELRDWNARVDDDLEKALNASINLGGTHRE